VSGGVQRATVIRPRLHRVFRGVGAALALLTAASPLVESWHEATVRHVACPEDGDLIDAPLQAPHQHARATNDGPALFAERDPSSPPASGQGHQHCAVVSHGRLRARPQTRSFFVVTVRPALAAVSVPDSTPRLRSFALYRLAPKASPPLS
jgi:hypothetical protein